MPTTFSTSAPEGRPSPRLTFVAEGTPAESLACPESLPVRSVRRRPSMAATRPGPRPHRGKWLTVTGAREHNLQDISIRIPLGVMTVGHGVSGSRGKSTLINDILYRSLAQSIYGLPAEEPGRS